MSKNKSSNGSSNNIAKIKSSGSSKPKSGSSGSVPSLRSGQIKTEDKLVFPSRQITFDPAAAEGQKKAKKTLKDILNKQTNNVNDEFMDNFESINMFNLPSCNPMDSNDFRHDGVAKMVTDNSFLSLKDGGPSFLHKAVSFGSK